MKNEYCEDVEPRCYEGMELEELAFDEFSDSKPVERATRKVEHQER